MSDKTEPQEIPIDEAACIAEERGLSHVVIFGYDEESDYQCVATFGKTVVQSDQAAKIGNKFKLKLGWPDSLCQEKSAKVIALEERVRALEAADHE